MFTGGIFFMLDETIPCAICGQRMATISWKHLATHNITTADYKQQFPDHPIKSPAAEERKRISATKGNASRKGIPRSADVKDKISATKKSNQRAAWNKGIARTPKQNEHLSVVRKTMFADGSLTHWNTGNQWSQEVKDKIRNTALLQHRTYAAHSLEKRRSTYNHKIAAGWTHHSTEILLNKLSDHQLQLFNDKDWLYEQHITNQRTISSICVELGLHWKNSNKTVRRQLEKYNIPIKHWHQASSVQQREVEDFITSLGMDIQTRNRSIIPPLELDIVIPSARIAIEYCGLYWHTTEYKEADYHERKYVECERQGITLITIYSDEWLNNRTLVEHKLRTLLGKNNQSRVYARKCATRNINTTTKKQFFDAYHIQGNGPSSINVGLYYEEELVACMGLVQHTNGSYTLNRYATSCVVPGGFSKLLAHFVHEYDPAEIITFADRRWSTGRLYDQNGFTRTGIIPADYEYVDGELRLHKFNYRHVRLPTKLPSYDPSLTEIENTTRAGIHRIYDCGKIRYVWRPLHS